ncbi:MAG: hypothetical protein ACRDQ6_05480 [Pseudonocardiaceae bacterium]
MELGDMLEMIEAATADVAAETARIRRAQLRGGPVDLIWFAGIAQIEAAMGMARDALRRLVADDVCVIAKEVNRG